jgi:hypothetical protein
MRDVFASAQFESAYFSTILQLKTTQSEVRKSNIYYFRVLRPSETNGYSENSWMHPSTSTMPLVHPASEHSNREGNDEARSQVGWRSRSASVRYGIRWDTSQQTIIRTMAASRTAVCGCIWLYYLVVPQRESLSI